METDPATTSRRASAAGFSLTEILVVSAIIVIAFSMVTFMPSRDKKDGEVQAAAQELAATLREARALAMSKRCCIGVAFNLQNGAGTSGRQINNWTGHHWYRIVGPSFSDYQNTDDQLKTMNYPGYPTPSGSLGRYALKIEEAWLGDRHILRAHRVRFLALSDQDNGTCPNPAPQYLATYPRPWFGWWDNSTKRLYPWGGYNHALTDGSGNRVSAFSLEGDDGQLAGCVNPADRSTTDAEAFPIFKQGDERPVVNGAWLDYVIRFNPDGSVQEGRIMAARMWSGLYPAQGSHLGDLINGAFDKNTAMTSYEPYTGVWAITLAPDIEADTDTFPTASAALQSLMPMYRIFVGPLGTVRVVHVQNSPPRGTTVSMDSTITNWQVSAQTQTYYQNQLATNANGLRRGLTSGPPAGQWHSVPASEFVLTSMLSDRQWWMKVAP